MLRALAISALLISSPAGADEQNQYLLRCGDETLQLFRSLARNEIYRPSAEFRRVFGEEIEGNLNAYPISTVNKEDNEGLLRKVQKDYNPVASAGRKSALTSVESRQLFLDIRNHPVAGTCDITRARYERGGGMCFGRAMATHVKALQMGLDRDSILKIWYVLPSGINEMEGVRIARNYYDHHVATMVRVAGAGGVEWRVIDPLVGDVPLPVEAWHGILARTTEFRGREGRLFITEARRLGITAAVPLDRSYMRFLDDRTNDYFTELCRVSRESCR